MRYAYAIVFGLTCVFLSGLVQAESRHALVIGNSAYQLKDLILPNPVNDSRVMADTLKKLFFEVTLVQDATKSQMEQAVNNYIAQLKSNGGIGIFFFAGHGVQLEGNNYLVPVDIKFGSKEAIEQQSYSVTDLLNSIRGIESSTNIIILDACRDSPFSNLANADSTLDQNENRGVNFVAPKIDSGLTALDAPPNTLIAFATAPGSVARDGQGRNSPYTTALVNALQNTGLTITEVFNQVRNEIMRKTNKEQIPWETSSLLNNFPVKSRVNIIDVF